MTEGTRALAVSTAIHLALVVGLVASVRLAATPQPPRVLELDLDRSGGVGRIAPAAGPPGPPAAPGPRPAMPRPASVPAPAPVMAAAVHSQEAEAAPTAAIDPPEPPVPVAAYQDTPSAQGAGHSGSGSAAGAGSGSGPGIGGGLEVLRQIYRKEHFAYIQALVARRLVYPPQAARAGWTGRVLVSFLVREDGSVTEAMVSGGSGVLLLDQEALAAVRRAAPFPRPPVPARLVIPIEFDLE